MLDTILLYSIFGLIGIAIVVIIIIKPYMGLAFTISSLSLYYITYLPAGFNFTSLTGILGGVTLISYIWNNRDELLGGRLKQKKILIDKRIYTPVLLLSFEILIWDFLVPIHVDRIFIFTYVQLILLIWLTEKIIKNPQQLETIMKIFLVANIVALALSLRNFDFFAENAAANRLTGLSGNANEFAIYIGISIIFLIYFLGEAKRLVVKIVIFLFSMFLFIPILLSGSRGGFLFLVIALAYQLWRFRWRGVYIFAILFLLVIFNSGIFASGYIERMLDIPTDLMTQSDTIGLRVNLWLYALELWKTNPIFGIGTGMFLVRSIDSPVLHGVKMLQAHNSFVTFLVEDGIIGLLLFLVILIKSTIDYEKAIRYFMDNNQKLMRLAITWQTILLLYVLNSMKGTLNVAKLFWLAIGISMVMSFFVAVSKQAVINREEK